MQGHHTMKMIKRAYTLRFQAPAFLGNAEQSGQWRTPPFQAQLRQWWRVAYAADRAFQLDVSAMRGEEGRLFGNAWLGQEFSKSEVRIRLDQWKQGKLVASQWPRSDSVKHPEVPRHVAADLYLGYGPVQLRGNNSPTLKANAAIQAGEHATFSLAYPDVHAPLIERALYLMDRFGTVGGRGRNGWGSYNLSPLAGASTLTASLALRPWQDALAIDWPHALGQDGKGALVWQTRSSEDWKSLVKELAVIKIGTRTDFRFATGKNAPYTEDRHWLSYPVTNHSVRSWGGNARLPNSLRFKIRLAPNDPTMLVGVIFHMPCLPPPAFSPDRRAIETGWTKVHAFLDGQQNLTRISA
jgi:CRISPR-associated protein Cmr1